MKRLTFFILIFILCYCIQDNLGFNTLPDIRERSEWHITKRPAPIVKQLIYHEKYIDVVIGNPGHVTRLEIDFGCHDTIILFSLPEDTSRTWSELPNTVIVYFGPALVRLSFIVDYTKKDPKSYYPYEGYLCLGKHSDIWSYWGKLSLSPFRIVFGEYDQSLSRFTYDPFKLTFHHKKLEDTALAIINGENYSFALDLETEYTTLPRLLYHNITSLNIIVDKIRFSIDKEDISVHLINGFDKTMLRKSPHHNDTTIALGRHFTRNFVIYVDGVSMSVYVMPSFHLFNNGTAEPLYSNTVLFLITSLIIVWIAIITINRSREQNNSSPSTSQSLPPPLIQSSISNDHTILIEGNVSMPHQPPQPLHAMHPPHHPAPSKNNNDILVVAGIPPTATAIETPVNINAIVFYTIELYGYLATILILVVDLNAFAGYRHFSYILSTTSNTLYTLLNAVIMVNSLIGIVVTLHSNVTYRYLNIRRIFLETSLFFTLWVLASHQHKTHSVIVLVMIFSAIHVVMRMLHLFIHIVMKNFTVAFIAFFYTVLAVCFFILYNVIPVVDFFLFRFDDQFERVLLFIIVIIGLPSLVLIAWYSVSVLRNTADYLNQTYLVKSEDGKKTQKMQKMNRVGDGDDDDSFYYPGDRLQNNYSDLPRIQNYDPDRYSMSYEDHRE
jgi:hypothetical protein